MRTDAIFKEQAKKKGLARASPHLRVACVSSPPAGVCAAVERNESDYLAVNFIEQPEFADSVTPGRWREALQPFHAWGAEGVCSQRGIDILREFVTEIKRMELNVKPLPYGRGSVGGG